MTLLQQSRLNERLKIKDRRLKTKEERKRLKRPEDPLSLVFRLLSLIFCLKSNIKKKNYSNENSNYIISRRLSDFHPGNERPDGAGTD
jgi:hypothetical protein